MDDLKQRPYSVENAMAIGLGFFVRQVGQETYVSNQMGYAKLKNRIKSSHVTLVG